MAGGESGPPHRVEQRQPATGAHHPGQFPQAGRGIGEMGDQPGGEHRVEAAVAQRQPRHVREGEARGAVPALAYGGGQHGGREIHSEDGSPGADRGAQRGQRTAGTASGVEHRVAGAEPEIGDGGGVGGAVVRKAAVPAGRPGGEEVPHFGGAVSVGGLMWHGNSSGHLGYDGEAMR
ncbi:hypothetical protein TPA0910_79100 [Streptomyces hygroscopicus subsp. sporocinereus]|uniref:Uncharacterized protein n=1 Tax=Streptomyces hygroscopicus TaxID=1912 RepID=A0ABQ3UD55_STRHY|nr:hypothetical protein TPA0910_79100 [Streptomyces hygroscopicus]